MLVVALVGVQNGVITPVMQLGGVLMALITTAMTGPLFDRFIGSATPVPAAAAATAPDSVVPGVATRRQAASGGRSRAGAGGKRRGGRR